MTHSRFGAAASALALAIVALLGALGDAGSREPSRHKIREEHAFSKVGDPGDETAEALNRASEYAQARQAPGLVLPGAYSAAFAALTGLPPSGGAWTEVTNRPYDADDPRYRDPYFSNSSGGAGLVAGRVTGLAVIGANLFAGGADGGVFRSTDNGVSWAPITDGLPTLSVGDLRAAPDGALWLATGEGNTGATSYVGSGVYRLVNSATGAFTVADRVGGTELESTFVHRVKFDGAGSVYAATSRGVWKHSATTASGAWLRVLYPVPDPSDPRQQSPYNNICSDVAIQPNTGGQVVIANCAWRGGAAYNGFYLSTDGAQTFAKVNPLGALNPQDIGRAQFAYSSDGSQLYATVESIVRYTNTLNTSLSGVYRSHGNVAGPWTKIADSQKLASSGSALKLYIGYRPGVQSWYNQVIAVDPGNPLHVYVGLEEIFETQNGGVTWQATGPYWNFEFPCWSISDASNSCSQTVHPDQHSIAFGNGRVYVGNDGGVYSRPINGQTDALGHATDWVSLNANLRTLQYYSVGVGKYGTDGVAVAGGLQDNGGSLLLPEDLTGNGTMGSPFGGDGGDIIVDPDDGCKILDEYVYLELWLTENCGRSDGTPGSIRDVSIADPSPRFTAPFRADSADKDYWIAGGRYLWKNEIGFAIQSGGEWQRVFDNGLGHSTTAIAVHNQFVYSAWCGPCNNDGFARGISTNVGGAYHQLTLPPDVPNRYISAIAIDTTDASGHTAYLGFNGFSRRWTEGPGVGLGHLWKTTDGGATWTDVSGNLPDIPVNDIVITGGKIYVGTDLGTVVSTVGSGSWSRLGSNLPFTTVMDLHLGPDGRLYAATHGRGIWSFDVTP